MVVGLAWRPARPHSGVARNKIAAGAKKTERRLREAGAVLRGVLPLGGGRKRGKAERDDGAQANKSIRKSCEGLHLKISIPY